MVELQSRKMYFRHLQKIICDFLLIVKYISFAKRKRREVFLESRSALNTNNVLGFLDVEVFKI